MSHLSMQQTIDFARRVSMRIKPSRKFQPLTAVSWTPDRAQIWENDLYEVTARPHDNGWPLGGGPWAQLGISCHDGEPRHDWRDFQAIKNQLCGEEWEAIELYPAESRLLDPSNYYILWCAPMIHIGKNVGRTIMHPDNCLAPQRGWPKGCQPDFCLNQMPATPALK
jgi:hypothetical protein